MSDTRYAPTIAALARPGDLRGLPIASLHLVMGIRFCALCDRVGRDPVAEMATRFGSVMAARGIEHLFAAIDRTWPEAFVVGRPCCMAMTPDEQTLAHLARFAMAADRAGFARELDGFVRPGRQETLYTQITACVAELASLHKRV